LNDFRSQTSFRQQHLCLPFSQRRATRNQGAVHKKN
jgi:hypothetical protein